jgi:hypothetical protein
MSYANAHGPRGYCARCLEQIQNPPNARSAANPVGQVPMACSFAHLGQQAIWSAEIAVTEDGELSVLTSKIERGRLGLGGQSTSGHYRIDVRDEVGTFLNSSAFDPSFVYTDPRFSGVDYSAIRYDRAVRGMRMRIPTDVGVNDRLKIALLKDGVLTSHTTVNGARPNAEAGGDRIVECNQTRGARVTMDGTGSNDADGDSLRYVWSAPGISFIGGTSARLSADFPVGETIVTLRVSDGVYESRDTARILVVDTTPPAITIGVDPTVLWPPNHRMVGVSANAMVTDVCDPAVGNARLISAVSSELDDAPGGGDGTTVHDIQGVVVGAPDFEFELRAERDAAGEGRVYEITYGAVDGSGNEGNGEALVLVPHERGGVAEPVVISAEEDSAGTMLTWGQVSGALSYRVVRGNVGSLQEAGAFVDLGTVACLQSNSSSTSTVGEEDAEIPPLGQAFFYLVAYTDTDGRDSSYGTDTTMKPRVKTGGGCE